MEKHSNKAEKEIAKAAMTAAIGIAVLTAPFLRRNRPLKNLHVSAGILLASFALWHHLLYQPKKKKVLPDQGEKLKIKNTSP
jgi:hypothetical protein